MRSIFTTFFLLFSLAFFSSCAKTYVVSQPSNQQIQTGQKVFVRISSQTASAEDLLEFMPAVTKRLRQRKLLISSGGTNKSSTPESLERQNARIKDFHTDFLLDITQTSNIKQTLISTTPQGKNISNVYHQEYAVEVRNMANDTIIWSGKLYGTKQLLGVYFNRLGRRVVKQLEKDGVLASLPD